MSSLDRSDYLTWDRLFDLLFTCDESATDAEIDADLARAGIDMTAANARLHRLVAEFRAKSELAEARERRASIASRLGNIVVPVIESTREGLRDAIARLASSSEQLAYFHKLESAATDEDLKSLGDDLRRLAALRDLGMRK